MAAPHLMLPCPCGSGATLADCCARFHAGDPAPDPERLMRSRYSAYALRHAEYLLTTWHASTRPTVAELALSLDPRQRWLGLEVRMAQHDGAHGSVEFVARSRMGGGRAQRHHEISRFVLEDGRWLYVDGRFPG